MRLKGKVAVVTGAGHGIGLGTAITLAKEGAYVVINDISEARAKEVETAIRAVGGSGHIALADVNHENQIKDMIDGAIRKAGKVDILVNVVGGSWMFPYDYFHKFTMDQHRALVNQNLFSAMMCTQAALPGMMERKYGKIIFTTSISAVLGQKRGASYAAAKAGLEAFAASLGKEVGPYGINVNCLRVGLADTAPGQRTPERFAALTSWSHLGRLGRPEEYGTAIAFLASDDSSYMSGSVVTVDGGASKFADF